MREFKRITIDPNVKNGLPCIRDTGITVSEIIQQTSECPSQQEILAKYPQVQPEDIYESLAYSINHIIEDISLWTNEGLGPLSTIRGFSEILLGKHNYSIPPITDETKHDFTEIIHHNAYKGIASWHSFRWSIAANYESWRFSEEIVTLQSIIKHLNEFLPKPFVQVTVDVTVNKDNPSVKINGSLSTAIENIVIEPTFFLKKQSTLVISQDANHNLVFSLYREYEQRPDQWQLENLLTSHPLLRIADGIIRKSNSEIQIHASDEGLSFVFHLPIWTNES